MEDESTFPLLALIGGVLGLVLAFSSCLLIYVLTNLTHAI